MTINTIVEFVCDWCEEVADEIEPTTGLPVGWREDSGKHFCCETCFDKHFARLQAA